MSFDVRTEVAQLFDAQRAFLCSSGDETAQCYQALSECLYTLIDKASEADFTGLADALALYGELLSQVCPEERYPNDQSALDLMVEAAGAFSALSRGDQTAIEQLTSLLGNSGWPEPVADDDTQFLSEILQDDILRLNSAENSADEDAIELTEVVLVGEDAREENIELDEVHLVKETLPERANELNSTAHTPVEPQTTPEAEAQSATQPKLPSDEPLIEESLIAQAARLLASTEDNAEQINILHDLVDRFSEAELSGFADSCALAAELLGQDTSDNTLPRNLTEALTTLLRAPSDQSAAAFLASLSDSGWPEPVVTDDIEFLEELLDEDHQRLQFDAEIDTLVPVEEVTAEEKTPAEPTSENSEQAHTFCEIDFGLLEEAGPNVDPAVLQMLTESLSSLVERWQQSDTDDSGLPTDTIEALTPIRRALDTLHLRGIHMLLGGLELNLSLLEQQHSQSHDDTYEQLTQCLRTVQEHLGEIENQEIQNTLIDLCASPALPCPLSEDQAAFLRGMLALASVRTVDEIVKQTASADDISVTVQDDLDPNLFDMLVAELPTLTEDLLSNLQQMIEADSLTNLDAARRIAHTIKGLGNMAGIQGLANLTHSMEDILDTLVDSQLLPGKQLKDDLLEAADCLAAMGEAVTEHAAPPEDALEVLQTVLDWSYLLKTEGAAAAQGARAESKAPTADTKTETTVQQFAESDGQTRREENFLRVPQSLLDTLFRITGESNTLTSQVDESITQLRTLTRVNRERQRHLQRIIFELEQQLNEYYTLHPELDPASEGFDPLEMDNYNEMHTSLSRLHESAADVREVEQEMDEQIRNLTDLHVTQTGLQKENLANILSTRLVAVKTISSRVQRIMRQACRAAGKQARLVIEGEEVQIDSQILAQLTDPLMHIIRNAVDHGLETPEERRAAGKPEEGTLTLRFVQENDQILVSCSDDGAGIDTDKIRRVAGEKGLIEEHTMLSDAELQRLILVPGFSTSDEVSQLSGRGIGMDVVYQQIMRMQGTLNIDSERGQGSRFELKMPSSSLMIRALLVRAGRQLVALSSHGIEQSILSLDGKRRESENGERFVVGEEEYPLLSLEMLLAEPRVEYTEGAIHPVLIINLGQGEKVALMVKEIVAHRELVFKEMGQYVPDIPGIPGVTILANGEAAPIIDLPSRILHQQSSRIEYQELLEQHAVPDLPKLMVVDDSISARKSLATLLKDTGYEVSTAIDGLDALNQIRKDPPDLVLTDLEMPRMSGIELSSAIRNNATTQDVPVIMITSRSTEKHREEAATAGVSDYLTKPWTEEGLLSRVQNLLG
ncbi:response regulator [Pontibacterium sp.]|uniref:hybrid sensor histidine kinase/response regulator n=1 Tax=Pontibacterium sp. TaxID=2036026 RepID=UPI003512D3C7